MIILNISLALENIPPYFWFILVLIIIILVFKFNNLKKDRNDYEKNYIESKTKLDELNLSKQKWLIEELDKFKTNEINRIQKNAENMSRQTALVELQKWKIEEEAKIRQDAINRSYAVNLGKITEHLVPYHVSFPFNSKDVKFIGSPIDMIVFDGYSENKDKITIYIVEVKTGNSRLSNGQKLIKKAVLNAEIRWCEINPDNISPVEFY